jgi:predicted N-acetyltransferase YhbS
MMRFGFESEANLRFGAAPCRHFQRLAFYGQHPSGVVEYHLAFAKRQ